jgi:hypothetical protein
MKLSSDRWKIDPVIYVLAIFIAGVHLLVINNLEYHRDELLYFSLGQHPATGYATVPPMIGWIAWLMQNIFGYSLFAVRLFPALMSGVMVILVSAIARELGGSRYASILASTGFIISLFGLRTYGLFQPVHLDLFFWTLSIYLVIKYINTKADKYLILFGVFAGLSLLNKYLIGLLFFSFILVIPFTQLRTIFSNRKFWIGIAAGFLIFLPNIIWQISRGVPLIGHLSELERTQLVNVDRTGFLFDQIMMPGIVSLLTIGGMLYLFINKQARKFRFLGIIVVLVVVFLMLLRGKSYYTIGVFPFLIAAGAVATGNILRKTLPQILLIIFFLILTYPVLAIGIPIYKPAGLAEYFKILQDKYKVDEGRRWEDGLIHTLPQDYADMLGWEEMTLLVNEAWQMVPEKKSCIIYGENYGQASAVTVIGKKYNLPEAVCFSESFRYWVPGKFEPDPLAFIYINDKPGEDVSKLFRKITKIGIVSNPLAREYGTGVFLFQDPVSSFNKFWSERLKRLHE